MTRTKSKTITVGQLRGSVSYNKALNLWAGRYRVDGRRNAVYGGTEQAARIKLMAALQGAEMPATPKMPTLTQYSDAWLAGGVGQRRAATLLRYRQVFKDRIQPYIGNKPPDKITQKDLKALMDRATNSGVSARTVNYVKQTLGVILGDAERDGYITSNPARLVRRVTPGDQSVRVLDERERQVLLSYSETAEPLWAVALATGMRESELLGLRWSDIDLEGRWVQVRRSVQRVEKQWLLQKPKTAKSIRSVPLLQVGVDALQRQRSLQAAAMLKAGAKWNSNVRFDNTDETISDLVFTNQSGGPLYAHNVLRDFHIALERAGLPKVRFHSLRHGTATMMLEAGIPMPQVSKFLGHSDIRITVNAYGHIGDTAMRKVADAMDAALSRS